MKELVIISGKGGTGKTSITSSFAALATNAVFADCDVDAADMHLILSPEVEKTTDFICGNQAVIRADDCLGCGQCAHKCRFDAINKTEDQKYIVDASMCEGCGVCVEICPFKAIDFPESNCGQWFVSQTRFGKMVHARLAIAAENSGKLVSVVREEAKKEAVKQNAELIIVDGPPGTGCPVIASITGADAVLIVTEPTISGIHDMKRVAELAKYFGVKIFVCINKWDINKANTEQIKEFAEKSDCVIVGQVPYTKEITKAQIQGKCVMEVGSEEIQRIVKGMWDNLSSQL